MNDAYEILSKTNEKLYQIIMMWSSMSDQEKSWLYQRVNDSVNRGQAAGERNRFSFTDN